MSSHQRCEERTADSPTQAGETRAAARPNILQKRIEKIHKK